MRHLVFVSLAMCLLVGCEGRQPDKANQVPSEVVRVVEKPVPAKKPEPIKRYDYKTWELVKQIQGPQGSIDSISFSPDGLRFIAAGNRHPRGETEPGQTEIQVWKTSGPEIVGTMNDPAYSVISTSISPDGTLLLAVGLGASKLWNIQSLTQVRSFENSGMFLDCLIGPEGKQVFIPSANPGIWNIADGTPDTRIYMQGGDYVAVSPDGSIMSLNDNVFNLRTYKKVGQTKDVVYKRVFTPNGKRLVSVGRTAIAVHEVNETGISTSPTLKIEPIKLWPNGMTVSHDSKFVATASNSSVIHIWSLETGSELADPSTHTVDVTAICFSPIEPLLIAGDANSNIFLFRPKEIK